MNLLITLFLSFAAFALPNPAPREKAYDLIKCTAPKLGTIWASFGHVISSDDPEPRYFFTEVNVIDQSDVLQRRRYWDHREGEAQGAVVIVRKGSMRLEFSLKEGESHKITLISSVRNDPNSFMGNWEWKVGEDSRFDQVACTAL
jgi:hypothetical protein